MIEPPDVEFMLKACRTQLEDDGGMEPILFFDQKDKGVIAPCFGIHPVELMEVLNTAMNMGVIERPNWMAVATDSYHIHTDTGEMPELHRGDLEKLFKAGDPRVGEAIFVQCVTKAGVLFAVKQGYIRSEDDKHFVFDDVDDYNDGGVGAGGALFNSMNKILGMD